jgi:branched-chain amino acid aminotransferase
MTPISGPGCVWVNGNFSSPAAAAVPALDHGVLFGDGLFETLRTYGGSPFLLDEHLARLFAGAAALAMPPLPSTQELSGIVTSTIARAQLPEAHVRITVLRGVSAAGLDPAGCTSPTLVISALPLRDYPDRFYDRGIHAALLWRREPSDRPPPWVKTTSYQRTVLARAELSKKGVEEGLFRGEGDTVTEGTVSNVFAVHGSELVTPSTDCCLPGITRARVIALAQDTGLKITERPLHVSELATANELFVSSSLTELVPVVRVDQVQIGSGTPGPRSRDLLSAYRSSAARRGTHR